MYKVVGLAALFSVLVSCGTHEEASTKVAISKEEIMARVDSTWQLLEVARNSDMISFEIPLGLELNVPERRFKSTLKKLTLNGEIRENGFDKIRTDYFGSDQEVTVSSFNYFSNPNTETDIVSSITFLFYDLKYEPDSKIREFLNQVDSLFDDSWIESEYQLDNETDNLSEYHKYWIKENIVAEFSVSSKIISVKYHNAPRSFDMSKDSFYGDVDFFYSIREEVDRKMEERASKPKVRNSSFDGSVYQVESYLKRNLKDPKSFEAIQWGKVDDHFDYYTVKLRYRAKNSLGGYVIESYEYKIDLDGNVIGATEIIW